MMPDRVTLFDEESMRVTRVRVARYLGQLPHQVDQMPYADYLDVQAVMSADNDVDKAKQEQANLKRK